jgi:hypothetical protein
LDDSASIIVDLADLTALEDPEGCCRLAAFALTSSGARILVGDARRLGIADVRALELLARLALLAGRTGCQFQLRGVSADLRELLDLCGLTRVVGVRPDRRRPPAGDRG